LDIASVVNSPGTPRTPTEVGDVLQQVSGVSASDAAGPLLGLAAESGRADVDQEGRASNDEGTRQTGTTTEEDRLINVGSMEFREYVGDCLAEFTQNFADFMRKH
jgi:hypothetical protein